MQAQQFAENLVIACLTDFGNHYTDGTMHHIREIARLRGDIEARYQQIQNLGAGARSLPPDLRPDSLVPLFRELEEHFEALEGNTPTNHLQGQDIPTPNIETMIREERERLGTLEPESAPPMEVSGQEVRRPTVLFEPEPIGPGVPARLVRGWEDIDIDEIPAHLLTLYERDWETYTGPMRPLGREPYIRYRYFRDGLDAGIFREGRVDLGPVFAGRMGAIAERMWSHITETPQNPGAEFGGRFSTPSWGNVEPDFIPAVDENSCIVFGRNSDYAREHNVPSISDALLVADSKFYGVYRDVPVINFGIFGEHANQVRGMIWLAHMTRSKTFVFLGRPNQQIGRNVLDFASRYGVDVEIRTDPRIR
jgi:hypothetical protein